MTMTFQPWGFNLGGNLESRWTDCEGLEVVASCASCASSEDTMGGLDDMLVHRNLTMVVCAAALALTACGGGGGGGGGGGDGNTPTEDEIAAAKARNEAVVAALEAARAVGTDGAFDDTPYMVAPVVAAADDGTTVTVGVTEGGTPRGGSARTGDFAEQEDGPAPIDGWAGARFRRGAKVEHLVVYADPGAPEAAAFTPENLNRLNEVSGLTGETVAASGLDIRNAWWPVIRSTSLAAAPPGGSTIYRSEGTGADAGREFVGTFAGGTGRFRCSGGNCAVTLNDKGMPTAMVGGWTFAPDSGAMVMVPDYDHLYFGWWLREEQDDAWGFQTFAGGVGFPDDAGNVTAEMEGTATYRGVAGGVWAQTEVSGGQVTAARSGEFTAKAELTANFFGAQDSGAVSGRIDSFTDGAGRSLDGWRVTLTTAPLTVGEASFAGRTGGAVGSGTSGEGHWEGRFHGTDGADANARPSHVTGRFDLHFPGAHLAGAFGAGR